tara:strand:- start:20440 stop:21564 length:1125 start_codon:yes stop_codon:yes gene_type:complete
MDLGFDEAQLMLKTSAREFLGAECTDIFVREMEEDQQGFTPEFWQKLANQGWLGLIFPEQYGGVELSFFDLVILLEETGAALMPGPFFATVVLGGKTVLEAGNDEQKQQILPAVAEGKSIVTLALLEPSATWRPLGIQATADFVGDGYLLNGTKLFVPYAHVADNIIVATRTGLEETDITLFLVPKSTDGISQTLLKTIASDRQSEVILKDVHLPASAIVGEVNKGWDTIKNVIKCGAIGKCAEMLGGSQKVLDMTVEYAKQRVQFGRPIGTFQAIQHHCADMASDVEGSRYVTYQAAWTISEGAPADQEVAVAKAWVSDAYRRVCAKGHQVHGAIGFTKEHNMQLYSRRAKEAELAFGDTDFHLETVATSIGL